LKAANPFFIGLTKNSTAKNPEKIISCTTEIKIPESRSKPWQRDESDRKNLLFYRFDLLFYAIKEV
jgi:hypothetical protein